MNTLQKDLSRHITQALNKTIKKIQKEQIKLIANNNNLPTSIIKKYTKTLKANPNNLKARILSLDVNIGLNKLQHKQVKDGVIIKFKSKPQLLRGYFTNQRGGDKGSFIAIRANSKHQKDEHFSHKQKPVILKKSKDKRSVVLQFPYIKESFTTMAFSIQDDLEKKAKEIFIQELEL